MPYLISAWIAACVRDTMTVYKRYTPSGSMFSSFNNFTHKNEELALVYDIGGGSVGGALVMLKRDSTPDILYTTRKSMPFEEKKDPAQLISTVKRGLTRVGKNLQKEGLQNYTGTRSGDSAIDGIYCIFGSPWFISHTQTVSRSFEKSHEIKEGYLDQLVQEAHTDFQEDALKEYNDSIEEELTLLEKHVMQVKLNKYKTNTPAGKHARDVQLSILFSVIPKQVKRDIQTVITQRFNTDHFHWHSFSLCAYSVLRNTFSNIELTDFLFMDISGELTDVLLVRDDVLVRSASFPTGANHLIRALADSRGIQTKEAASRINALTAGDLHPDEADEMTDALIDITNRWQTQFQESVTELFDEITLPNHLFYISANNTGPVFAKIMENTVVSEHDLQNDTLENVLINGKLLAQYRDYTQKSTRKDAFLDIGTMFANTIPETSKWHFLSE